MGRSKIPSPVPCSQAPSHVPSPVRRPSAISVPSVHTVPSITRPLAPLSCSSVSNNFLPTSLLLLFLRTLFLFLFHNKPYLKSYPCFRVMSNRCSSLVSGIRLQPILSQNGSPRTLQRRSLFLLIGVTLDIVWRYHFAFVMEDQPFDPRVVLAAETWRSLKTLLG
ncbi:hypothetical protein BKA57DRAFT_276899 [Linnemannia elongata]|nr:hypothetical protein BKA57DRAFT_276899 [Linnemannia elongata]